MNKRIATLKLLPALLILPLLAVACDKAPNPVAPTGSVITIAANPARIAPNGTSTLTLSGFRPDGNRLNPGTQIRLTASLGSLSANIVEIGADGFATATLNGDGRTGDSTVSAKLTTDTAESTVTVKIDAPKPSLIIVPARTEVEPGEESFVTIFARDENGNPFGAGENIQLAATLGDIQVNGREVTTVTTDSQGRGVFTFVAGEVPGTAKITAFLRNSDTVTQEITIRDVEDDFTVAFDRTEVANGEKVTITVVVFNGAGRPARGILVTFSVSGASGTLNPVSQTTSQDGVASSSFTLNDTSTATFFDITVTVGRLTPFTKRITIRR